MLTKDYSMVGAGNYRALGPNPACELILLSFQTKNGFYIGKRIRICKRKRPCIWLIKIFNISLYKKLLTSYLVAGVKVHRAIST